jgi:hypothetical protein
MEVPFEDRLKLVLRVPPATTLGELIDATASELGVSVRSES